MQLPSVKQLQYLIEVNETKHFGRAAEKCFVTQSALSTGIRELENSLNVTLFERSKKQIATTPLGEELGAEALAILAEISRFVEMAELKSAPLSGPLRFGLIPTVTPFLLPHLLPGIREKFENVEFIVTEGLTGILHSQLLSGDIDAFVTALPMDLKGTTQRVLFEDPLMVAYRENSALLDPNVWPPSAKSLNSLMLLEEGHCLREHSLKVLPKDNKPKAKPFVASSLSTLIHMVESDMGFTLLPAMAQGSQLLKSAGIELSPIEGQATANPRSIALVWRENSVRGDDFEAIGAYISEVMQAK